ncbi:MAG TPA: P-II family nitrogen regulator [Eubacteriaceae bacterium]|jgi:nitrogen regulatory protein PII 2|nr:P-II family nitrogen regulator [Eubacteriaceae bacterium]
MKEIMAVIRMNKMNETKRALSEAGYPSMLCKKVTGRGKKMVNMDILEDLIEGKDIDNPHLVETITENNRFIAKRLIYLVVHDEDVKNVVDILIDVNQTGNMGDGKIFICPVDDAVRVRTDESGDLAI